MRILFIVKEKKNGISPFIQSQAKSLKRPNVEIEFFFIKGKGLGSYFVSAIKLRQFLKTNSFDILHAHYGLSGWTAVLSFSQLPIVLSLMGSDILGEYQEEKQIALKSRFVVFSTFLLQYLVKAIIAKSKNIHDRIKRKSISTIIANGVDLEKFNFNTIVDKKGLGLKESKKYILFLGNPDDKWKNYHQAKKAVELIDEENLKLIAPFPISHDEVSKYLNVTNVFLHTSFMEGSSNVIKEAMACNCPIVYTDVGDARWVVGETEGCYLTDFSEAETAEKIQLALLFSENGGRTDGRSRILDLGLDTKSVADKIICIYKNILSLS